MKQIHSDIIQFRGSHFDFGFYQGKLLKDSLSVQNRDRQWLVRRPRFQIHVQETKDIFKRFSPLIWEELLGLQEALKWPMEKVLQEFGGYRTEYVKSGCSIVTGKDFLVRNYDYHPKTYEGRYAFFQPTDGGFASLGPSQRVTGRMDGMNEKGLAIGYNFMNRKKPGDGFICCMIGRLLLNECANTDDAIQLLKEIPHRHSFTYVVFDASGQSFAIETSPRDVKVRETNACTNHFEMLTDENRRHLVDSKRRLAIIEDQYNKLTDASQAFRLFNDSDGGLFSDLYGSWAGTIHTSCYLPEKLEAWFAIGADTEPYIIHVNDWLQGKVIHEKQFTGKIDTDIPFLHIDQDAYWK